ncbi:MAG TPA: hypothetical protein VJY15_01705 [Candidatus Acidoferrum sp.]|nr:hypothetical protein [Candidatus Acidoferrum sp.]
MTREDSTQNRNSSRREVNATNVIVSTLGVLFALAGIDHGFFETLQGNAPTGGLIIHAIGERNRMWTYGTEDAFTLIPNFLASGITAIVVSLVIVVWSLWFVHRKYGSLVFLLLFILLFLGGGGVAQVLFFTIAWAVATRINKPLTWWRAVLPKSVRGVLAPLWSWCLIAFTLLGLVALEIAVVGFVPGVNDPKLVLHICWSLLGVGLGFLLLAIVSGFAHDLNRADRLEANAKATLGSPLL